MATQRQIEANRKNARLSTGPSESGKARSRLNATKHGMAGESDAVEADGSAEFRERRADWGAEHAPVGRGANWALDRAVAASLRIERCERALDDLTESTSERAKLAWDEDRAVEAATLAGRLARDPALASRQLQTTMAGVVLLVEAWFALLATLQTGRDWSEPEASRALDLLGVDPALRGAPSPIDDPTGADPIGHRRLLATEEIDRLGALRDEAMVPLDDMDRRHAIGGDLALLSKPARLILRYERAAWRRYRDAMKQVQAGEADPIPIPVPTEEPTARPSPAPLDEPAKVRERPSTAPSPSNATPTAAEQERRAIRALAEPFRLEAIRELTARGLHDEDAWIAELDRRIEAHPFATERTQFEGDPVGRGETGFRSSVALDSGSGGRLTAS